MFNQINKIFNFNENALNIYSQRQEILASNIANADTPGYKSKDINFQNELIKSINQKNIKNSHFLLKKTSPQHLNAKNNTFFSLKMMPVIGNQIKSNKNTVDMNRERIEFIDNSLKYQSSLVFIKHEIKNIIQVLKG